MDTTVHTRYPLVRMPGGDVIVCGVPGGDIIVENVEWRMSSGDVCNRHDINQLDLLVYGPTDILVTAVGKCTTH